MKSIGIFCLAALFDIAGCFSVRAWIKLHRSAGWLVPGVLSLVLFAWLLTRVESSFAGRAYAAYGGIYIMASLLWMWLVEKTAPDCFDLLGASLCLAGTGVILLAPRAA